MEKIAWDGPKYGQEDFFPTNPDLANILGRTDLDFEDFFFYFLVPKSLDFQVPKIWISRLPKNPHGGRGAGGPEYLLSFVGGSQIPGSIFQRKRPFNTPGGRGRLPEIPRVARWATNENLEIGKSRNTKTLDAA